MAASECTEENVSSDLPKDWDSLSPDEFSDELFAAMQSKGPFLTPDDMDKIERLWEEERRTRRCALVLLTMPFAELRDSVEQDRDFAGAVAEVFRCTKDLAYYKGMVELLQQANLWAMTAIACREDMAELLTEADVAD
ncbi:MAG: hypothetical protein HZA64_07005 [Rhodocyclales bacterium]|nr:hypothetical protein [Rhodocyclales bacterium]